MKFKILIALLPALFSAIPYICHAGTGRTAASFLGLDYDARSAAMGRAFGAMSGDIGCIFYNPAGLGNMEEAQGTATFFDYSKMFGEASEGMYAYSLAGGMPINLGLSDRSLGAIAAGLQLYDQGSILITTDSPDPITEESLGKSWALTFSYADQLSNLSAGLSVKAIHQQLYNQGDTAFAMDLGLQYDLLKFFVNEDMPMANDPDLGLKIGTAIRNLGTGIQMSDAYQTQPLPRELSFGASVNSCVRLKDLLPDVNAPVGFAILRLNLSGGFNAYIDKLKETEEDKENPEFDKKRAGVGIYAFFPENIVKNIGVEAWLLDILAIRLGYLDTPDMPGDFKDKLVYGFGLRVPVSSLIALITGGSSELTLFDRLYHETDRQLFLELDYTVTRGADVPGGKRPFIIAFKMGI